MLLFVIIFNFLLTLLNLYVAFRLLRLRRVLARVTRTLTMVERRIHRIFAPAPEFVLKGQMGTAILRSRYQKLLFQIALMGQLFSVVGFAARFWQRQPKRKRRYNLL